MKRYVPILLMLIFVTGCGGHSTPNANTDMSTDQSNIQQNSNPSEDMSSEESDDVVAVATPNELGMWQEYIKTDDFGEEVEKESKNDISIYGELHGTGRNSISVNQYDYTIAIGISDYTLWGEKSGELVTFFPVSSGGTKAISIEEKAIIKAKASDGETIERKNVTFNNGIFLFEDKLGFITEHLKKGDDIQCILSTKDGSYEFKFSIPSDNYKTIYDEIAAKQPVPELEVQEEAKQIETIFDEETAQKVAYVALNNMFAWDIYTDDGKELDVSKLHSFSDKSGCYMEITSLGTWEPIDDHTWQGEKITLVPANDSEPYTSDEIIMNAKCVVKYINDRYEVRIKGGALAAPGKEAMGTPLTTMKESKEILFVSEDLLQ